MALTLIHLYNVRNDLLQANIIHVDKILQEINTVIVSVYYVRNNYYTVTDSKRG